MNCKRCDLPLDTLSGDVERHPIGSCVVQLSGHLDQARTENAYLRNLVAIGTTYVQHLDHCRQRLDASAGCTCGRDQYSEAFRHYLRGFGFPSASRPDVEPVASVLALMREHEQTWRDKPDSYWLAGLSKEVLELSAALQGRHEHRPEVELRQIASIALNWLNMRQRC